MSKERLVELLREARCIDECGAFDNVKLCKGCFRYEKYHETAEHLLANGVIVPPCKVGDVVYYINAGYETQGRKRVLVEVVDKGIVDNMTIGDKGVPHVEICNDENEWTIFDSEDDFGKTVFLTREEAEAKLKEVSE